MQVATAHQPQQQQRYFQIKYPN